MTDTGHLLVLHFVRRGRHRGAGGLRRRRRGLLIADLADGWAGNPGLTGLLLSYGGHEPGDVRRAVAILADAVGAPDADPG